MGKENLDFVSGPQMEDVVKYNPVTHKFDLTGKMVAIEGNLDMSLQVLNTGMEVLNRKAIEFMSLLGDEAEIKKLLNEFGPGCLTEISTLENGSMMAILRGQIQSGNGLGQVGILVGSDGSVSFIKTQNYLARDEHSLDVPVGTGDVKNIVSFVGKKLFYQQVQSATVSADLLMPAQFVLNTGETDVKTVVQIVNAEMTVKNEVDVVRGVLADSQNRMLNTAYGVGMAKFARR